MRHQEWINELDEATQLLIVKKHIRAIRQIYKPSFRIVKYVVDKDPDAITQDCELDSDSQLYLINNYPILLNRIKNPTKEVCDIAVKEYPQNIFDIPNPTREQHFIALSQMPGLVDLYDSKFPNVDQEVVTYARMIM